MVNINPKTYNLSPRIKLKKGPEGIFIIIERKSRIIMKDGHKILSNVKKIEIDKSDKKPLCIIIGPEGDFSEEERKAILNFEGVKSMRINENILRSETAAISAISILNYITSL